MTEDKVPNADVLLLLARLADARGDVSDLSKLLELRATGLRSSIPKPGERPTAIDPSNIVVAAAALKHKTLRPVCVEIFDLLVEHTYGGSAARVRPFLRIAHAAAVQLHRGESGPEVLRENRLKYWVPVSGKTSQLNARGAVDAMWLVHEDHVLHLAGARNDVLFFRYPLTGEFEFTCETQEGGRITTDGGLVYGGRQFQALGSTNQLTVWDADIAHYVQKTCPFVRHQDRPTFNRVSIRSNGDGVQLVANRHPVWSDDAAASQSPWLGLRSFDERRPIFRNLTISGSPVIPRKVKMSQGDSLRGWVAGYYGERIPMERVGQENERARISGDNILATHILAQNETAHWFLKDGIIHGKQQESENPQSRLYYQRPLLDGESITYEFHYEAGAFEVHPALGRLAFLIEPSGVRLHWMTDGDREWTRTTRRPGSGIGRRGTGVPGRKVARTDVHL